MIDKKQALRCRQSPLQKAMGYAENALKIVGTVKGLYDTGKQIYEFGTAAVPVSETAASLLL